MSDVYSKMSDMASSHRITVRVPATLEARIRDRSRSKGQTPSDVVRIALENYLSEERNAGSAYELAKAAKLIGCVRRAPRDLSTNPQYFEGFGTDK
jgi:metal-responsive CopG/Arc/MetJ family transcriptional regulator